MRILFKLFMKLVMLVLMVLVTSSVLKHGTRFITGGPSPASVLGAAGGQVTAEESDLMSTIFQSALKLLSGKASRSELSSELSDKLYGQRGEQGEMAELGIELVKPKAKSPGGELLGGAGAGSPQAGAKPDAKSAGNPAEAGGARPAQKAPAASASGVAKMEDPATGPELVSGKSQAALGELWQRIRPYSVELSMVPVVFLGMVLVGRMRRRKREADFVPEFMAVLPEADCETYEMTHAVQSLTDEEFELLVAMIYQRQGYRVSMPSALGGGRAGDFKLSRKSERLLVRCKKMSAEQRVQVEQVRELHDAMGEANATGGLYVTSCNFSWDARHFAKTRNIRLIHARTLDTLLKEARATPEEELLAIGSWVSKFMTKVEMTTPLCPECEAPMEQVKEGEGSVWLCSQRPECGGRRAERKYRKALRTVGQKEEPAEDVGETSKRIDELSERVVEVAALKLAQSKPAEKPKLAEPRKAPEPEVPAVSLKLQMPASTPPEPPKRDEGPVQVIPGVRIPSPSFFSPAKPKTARPVTPAAAAEAPPAPAAPSVVANRKDAPVSESQVAVPRPAPAPLRTMSPRRRAHLPIPQPATKKLAQDPVEQAEPGVSARKQAVPRQRDFPSAATQPMTSQPASVSARGGIGRNGDGAGAVAAFKRRGFRVIEEIPSEKVKAAYDATGGEGSKSAESNTVSEATDKRSARGDDTPPANSNAA